MMFKFKTPGTKGYQEAVEKARGVNAVRHELEAITQGPMLQFADAAALKVAIDREIESKNS